MKAVCLAVMAAAVLITAIRAEEPETVRRWTAVSVIDGATYPRIPTYEEAIDREGGANPWYDEQAFDEGSGLAEVQKHFGDRIKMDEREDVLAIWETGSSPMQGQKHEVDLRGNPEKCLSELMSEFGIAAAPWGPGEIRDLHIGDVARRKKWQDKVATIKGSLTFREALIELARTSGLRVSVILDVTKEPPIIDVCFEGVALFGLRDRRATAPKEPPAKADDVGADASEEEQKRFPPSPAKDVTTTAEVAAGHVVIGACVAVVLLLIGFALLRRRGKATE